jgi:hypothetical protein
LDESLQDTFAAFLAERGVDESLCESCCHLTRLPSLTVFSKLHHLFRRVQGAEGESHQTTPRDYTDEQDYVSWLADAKAFVEQ